MWPWPSGPRAGSKKCGRLTISDIAALPTGDTKAGRGMTSRTICRRITKSPVRRATGKKSARRSARLGVYAYPVVFGRIIDRSRLKRRLRLHLAVVQVVALQRIEDKHYPSISHDGRALKHPALIQSSRQGLNQHLHFGQKPIHYKATPDRARLHDCDRKRSEGNEGSL